MRGLILAASAALVVAGAASADVVVSMGSASLAGGASMSASSGDVSGAMTGFTISFGYVSGGGGAWASDAALVINGAQYGGYDILFGTAFMGAWGFDGPGSGADGAYGETRNHASSAAAFNLVFGNGWSTGPVSSFNDVTVTLHGVNAVPAPGALALLGLAGFAGRRRRAC